MTDQRPGLAPTDLAVDHALSRLAEGVRLLLAIDARGHGRSEGPHDPAAYGEARMAARRRFRLT